MRHASPLRSDGPTAPVVDFLCRRLGYARTVADGEIRREQAADTPSLSALAMRSKAHWGYSEAFLEIVRPMLTFTEHDITANPVYVLEGSDGPAGM